MKTRAHYAPVLFAAAGVLALVGLIDYRLQYQLGLLLFYALPLAWAAWATNFAWALALALASSGVWGWTDAHLIHHYAHGWIPWERGLMRMIILSFIMYSFHLFRRDLAARAREVKQLEGILPVCIACNRISDANGQWTDLETYLRSHSQAMPQPRLCPECTGLGRR